MNAKTHPDANPDLRIRVGVWGLGNVGRQSISAIALRDGLEIVTGKVRGEERSGIDIGEAAGGDKLGVAMTHDLEAFLAAKPDCVIYTPLHHDVDEMCALLSAGVNIVTSAEFLSGRGYGVEATERLRVAAETGGATLFGSGMNPGFAEYLAGVLVGMCRRVHKVTVLESFDLGAFAGDPNMDHLGWGKDPAASDVKAEIEQGTLVFSDAVDVLADLLGVTLDEVRCEVDLATATKDLDLPGRFIAQGTVAGMDVRWDGLLDGKPVIEIHTRWVMGRHIEPQLEAKSAYLIDVDGDPRLNLRLDIMPYPEDLSGLTLEDFHAIGMVITATPLVNAIPAVVAAPAGLASYADLPVITSQGVTSPRPS